MVRKKVPGRVDPDVLARFREFVKERKGRIHGELGREVEKAMIEYMDNDRAARVESKLDQIEENLPGQVAEAVSQELAEREKRKPSNNKSNTSAPGSQTTRRLELIANDLPADTSVSEAMLETPIEAHGGSSPKTVAKYKRLLTKRGHIFEHPAEPEQYVTSARSFALICETTDLVKARHLDTIIGEYTDVLGGGWYLDALPNSFIEGDELKYDQIADSRAYREKHGLFDDERGFQ